MLKLLPNQQPHSKFTPEEARRIEQRFNGVIEQRLNLLPGRMRVRIFEADPSRPGQTGTVLGATPPLSKEEGEAAICVLEEFMQTQRR